MPRGAFTGDRRPPEGPTRVLRTEMSAGQRSWFKGTVQPLSDDSRMASMMR